MGNTEKRSRYVMYLKEEAYQERVEFLEKKKKERGIVTQRVEGIDGVFVVILQKPDQFKVHFYEEALRFLSDLKGEQVALSVMTQRDFVNEDECFLLPPVFIHLVKSHAHHYAQGDNNTSKLHRYELFPDD